MTEKEKKEQLDKKYEQLKKEAEDKLFEQDSTYDDGTKVFLSKDECIEKGIECHNEKRYLAKEMNSIAKACSEESGVDKKTILAVKDYIHYKGRGWGDDCINKSEEKEKYPDRISPVFRKLIEIITNVYTAGQEELLSDYIEAAKIRGVHISIDEKYFVTPNKDEKEAISNAIKGLESFQNSICEKNDYLNDVLAVDAENANISPKNKFKQIIQLAVKKQDGKDIGDKIQDEYVKMELFTNGLEIVNEM